MAHMYAMENPSLHRMDTLQCSYMMCLITSILAWCHAYTEYSLFCSVKARPHDASVSHGSTYAAEHKCRDFTVLIGESMRDDVLVPVKRSGGADGWLVL